VFNDTTLTRPKEWLATTLVWFVAISIAILFLWLISNILWHGAGELSWSFISEAPTDAGRAGGIAPILVSTLLILLVCLVVSFPLGLGAAILLAEFSKKQQGISQLIRRSLDILAGVPSIVIGLFGNAFFSVTLGLGFSILAGGLTLACMVLPIFIRSSEEGFRAVPQTYRDNAMALGLSKFTTLWHILLPLAMPAIMVGLVLSIGRALAETAALIFTSGYVDRMPESLLDSGRALSIHIFDLSMNVPGGDTKAYGSALVLLLLLLFINISTQWGMRRFTPQRLATA